ncbi:glycine-rich selenoprotein-like [Contarinia nasturtii]|uniref:glycine-rich selenoprotein-like n=1 Tax=Contarinia nasturtii TaxID=265458 RepID=UPI0012D3AEDB|nr:glycine-rich selenoprotein-like [Contarinia nasturtii]
MVYVDRDGRVCNQRPWSMSRIFSIFMGIYTGIILFLETMFSPFASSNPSSGGSRRGFWGGGSGGSGGSGGNDGRGPPRNGPRRPIGRIQHYSEINGGGCAGGSCGR